MYFLMKTILNTVTILFSAVCPPSNHGEVMGQGDEEATGGWRGRPYKGTQGSGILTFLTPRFALFSCLNIVFCDLFICEN